MKQICTLLAFVCLSLIGYNVYGQSSLTISKTNPAPTPGFGTPDSVSSANGFTSTNTGTFHDLALNATDTIMSPSYSYATNQSAVYLDLNIDAAGTNRSMTVLIITANGDTLSASATQNYKFAGVDYYYTFTFPTTFTLLANTVFKVALTMPPGSKSVSINTFAINAPKTTAKAPVPLPVKFSSFTANKIYDAVSLSWTVGTEDNVAGYEIQKSTDGNTFSKIGFVAAAGHSSYTYVDNNVSQTAFYRIRSVDIDSKYIYSSILSLKGDQSDVMMKAFPSPVQSQLTVQHSSATGNSKIDVVSVDGRLLKSVSLAAGSQQTLVDLSSAKAGVYVIRLVTGNNIQSIKVTKQ